MDKLTCDLVVVGSDIAGLWLAKKLAAEYGQRVDLVEKANQLASGASTRNEGWLHSEAYHAAAIPDKRTALQVAARWLYSYEQIRRYAPEAIENPTEPVYALMQDPLDIDEITSRWNEVGVRYQYLPRIKIVALAPEIHLQNTTAAFRVFNLSINTCILSI